MSSLHFCAAAHSGPLRICEGLSQTRPIFHTLPKRIPEKPGTALGSSPALCHFGCEPSASSMRKDGGPNNALRAGVPEERPQGARGLLSTLCVYRPPSGLPHVSTWLCLSSILRPASRVHVAAARPAITPGFQAGRRLGRRRRQRALFSLELVPFKEPPQNPHGTRPRARDPPERRHAWRHGNRDVEPFPRADGASRVWVWRRGRAAVGRVPGGPMGSGDTAD